MARSAIVDSLKNKTAKAPAKPADKPVTEVVAETVTVQAETVIVAEPTEVPDADNKEAKSEAPNAAVEAVADTADGGFDWDTLPAAEVAVYSRGVVTKDLEATTPAFIKGRVRDAFEKTQAAGLDEKGNPIPVYVIQDCGTAGRADEFYTLAKKYAAFLGYTLRGQANPVKLATSDGDFVPGAAKVRFSVKPRETRKRLEKPVSAPPAATDAAKS